MYSVTKNNCYKEPKFNKALTVSKAGTSSSFEYKLFLGGFQNSSLTTHCPPHRTVKGNELVLTVDAGGG